MTDVAGTTRDVLQETVRLGGISLNIMDTAGIRNTEDIVEKIGVEKAKQYAEKADLILYVADTSVNLDENDREIISFISSHQKNVTEEEISQIFEEFSVRESGVEIVMVKSSAKNNSGLEELEKTIKDIFFRGEIKSSNEIVITNMRHKEAFQEAYNSLELVKKSIQDGMPEDFYSIDLMSAYSSLGRIIGEEVDDDLVEEIFSKFCMGK